MKKATFITIIVLSIFTISLFGAAKDTTPPTVSITNPKDNAVVSGVVTIKVDASDSSGIAKVEFYVGDSKLGEDSSKPYEYSWDTKKIKDGTYVLTAKATDSAGNKNSASIKVVVNNTKVETWQKTFGEKYDDGANSIQQTTDGGYIVAGWTYSFDSGGHDAYILKLNSKGEVQWQKTFVRENSDDEAKSVRQTTDGGYIVAGRTGDFESGDLYILKLNSKGEAEWEKTFGGEYSDVANSIQQTTDGGYTVAGWTNSFGSGGEDLYILNLNSKGEAEWEKTFGGGDDDVANSIQQTTNGGYIVAGWTKSFGSGEQDAFVLKLNSKGEAEWQKTFGGKDDDEANSIQQTKDGGYIVAGWTKSSGSGLEDVYVLKLNSKGDLEWQKTFGGKGDDEAKSIQQTKDGGYIVAGWTRSFGSGKEDIYILKLNSNGEVEWQKTFGGENSDGANSIQQTTDSGYIVAGWTKSFGSGGDICLLKLDSKGWVDTTPPEVKIISPSDWVELSGTIEINIDATDNVELEKVTLYIDGKKVKEYSSGPYKYSWGSNKATEGTHTITVEAVDKSGNVQTKSVTMIMDKIKDISWQKTFGGKDNDEANSIQQTTDGGYIVAGETGSFGSGLEDVYILKLNSKGEVQWQKTFGGEGSDEANSIQQTTDGGYIVAGWTESFGFGGQDVYILKLNSNGELEWQKTFGGKYDDGAESIQHTADGGYIIAGWTKSFGSGLENVYILKLNSKGQLEWQKTFGRGDSDEANSIQQTTDGGYIVAGWTKSSDSGEGDVYILKLNSKGEVQWQKTFGGKYDDDVANLIQQTADGGYIVAGWTKSFGSGWKDVYILKLNSKGEKEWQKMFGGEYDDEANSIQQTTDGGYIVAGWTKSFGSGEKDVYILKLNSKGEVEWQKTFGGKEDDEANSIQQATDGGYIVTGWTSSFGSAGQGQDVYILKLNSKGEIDTTPPEVKIISPSNGVELGGTIEINIDAKDNYDLEKVTLYIDGKKVKEYTSGPYKYTWDSSKATEGAHTIAVEGIDLSGNVGRKSIATAIVDRIKDVSWQKTFGGEDSDGANSVQQTTDGGYIVAGWTSSFGSGGQDVYILKLNSKGEVEWQKAFGGKDNDGANSIQQTTDGGYIVAGYMAGAVYILKLNSKGEVEWQKMFGGEDSDDEANLIQQTTDGGYIVAGWTKFFGSGWKDIYILKLNSKGEVEWQKTFGGWNDEANSIQQTTDGGYIVAGWTESFGSGDDVYILKLNSKGEAEWQKTFGEINDDVANSIQQTTDGGYIVAGRTGSFGSGGEDVYILKLNSKGQLEWQKTFGGGDSDEANSIQQTTDGGYIVAGWTKSFHSGDEGVYKDVYILKLDSEGEIQWQKTFGGKDDDEANSIQQTTDGGYIVAGVTGSFGFGEQDAYILKVDVKGWLDTIPPDVKIISPRDGVELGGTIDINIDAKDNYELEKVTLYIDGKKVKEYTTGPYKYTWDSSKASEGAHTITVEAVDKSGNVETKSVTLIMDKTRDISWEKTFGGKGDDEANSIQQTTDGGYIVAGWTESFGSAWWKDIYILKLNSEGEVEWQKTFGGGDSDEAKSIQQTTDGGYIVVGRTGSFGSGGYDVYILKLNVKGEIEWQKTFGGKDYDEANSVQQTIDGGYIVAGWTKSFGSGGYDVYILKLNSKGEVEWQKTFGGWNDDEANSIQQTIDGGYIVAGWTKSFGSGGYDVYILKLNSKGEVEWQKTFGGWNDDEANSIQQTIDGGYIVAGWTKSFGSRGQDAYILKLNSKGEVEWQKTFGGKDDDEANLIQQTTDGGYIVAGWTKSFGSGEKDVYILKLNSKGEVEWQKTFGGEYDDEANSIQQTTDGGYIVAGWTESFGFGEQDAYILKVDVKGWLDTIPPDVKIISPRDGVELGGTIDINIDAKDNYDLEKVTLYIDGKKVKEYTTGPYKYTWDSSKASEGAHTITVEAIDLSGNVGRKSIATAIIDRIKDVSWQKTFGGKNDDEANSIQQTIDGGYIVAGYKGGDVYILKLNSKGEIEWEKTFGGNAYDGASSIQQTTDDGYIVAGWTKSFGSGGYDVYILKLNSKGEAEWQKTFGGKGDDEANSIQQTTDGGYIVAGWTKSFGSGLEDIYILKLNSKGEVEWQKTFGGWNDDAANSIQQTTDGGYIVAGVTGSFGFGEQDAYILKLNLKGEAEWQKTFGGKGDDEAKSIQQTTDGGYVVAGWTKSFGSAWWKDVYILKLNSKGEVEWQKTFGGEYDDEANSIQQTTDGGYVVAGWTKSFGSGREDVYILKLNEEGDLGWQKTFGGWNDDEANSIQQTTDGGYIVAGWTYSFGSGGADVYILKLDSKGWVDTIPPEVKIISPKDGVELGGTIEINIDATDNVELEKVTLYIDGKKIKEYTSGPYKYSWDSSKATEGAHTIIVEAEDRSGNVQTKSVTMIMDKTRDISWEKTFGGNGYDGASSIQQTTDGGYIVAGWTESFGSGEDVYILKLDSNGEVEWQKTFGGEDYDEANSIQQTKDGGYIVAGWTKSFGSGGADAYILKFNSKGEIGWEKTFGGKGDDEANSIQQTTDGGYIVAGWTGSFGSGGYDVYILKLNSKGEVEWQKTFGGEDYDVANSIHQTTDGGYIVAGWTSSFGSGEADVYILKLNSKGEMEWQKTFGGKGDDEANSIQQTTDGGYIVVGWTKSFGSGWKDVYILKLNSKGEIEWQKTFGGKYDDEANSIQQTTDGEYIVAGYKDGDVYILKLNSKGEMEWQKTFGGEYNDEAEWIHQTTDGGYIVAGWTYSFDSRKDFYILKLNSKGEIEE